MSKHGTFAEYPPRSLAVAEAALLTIWPTLNRYHDSSTTTALPRGSWLSLGAKPPRLSQRASKKVHRLPIGREAIS